MLGETLSCTYIFKGYVSYCSIIGSGTEYRINGKVCLTLCIVYVTVGVGVGECGCVIVERL